MRGILDMYQSLEDNDLDEPVERYERVFDKELVPLIRTKFYKDSDVRNLVYAFDVLRELIDNNPRHENGVLVRISEQKDYNRNLSRLSGFSRIKYTLIPNVSYLSHVLLETFFQKKEYEYIYRFISLFEDNTVRFKLDGTEFILQKDDSKRKVLGVDMFWLHDVSTGKGINFGISAEVDPYTSITLFQIDADL